MPKLPITADDVRAAAQRIKLHVHRTPVLTGRSLNHMAGADLYLKAENMQRVGAFKARGAFNALLQMETKGVITLSSGNHGQALALAGRELGVPVTVIMAEDSNPSKIAAAQAYGAQIETKGVANDTREERLRKMSPGLDIVHPFNDLRVIAGQGTVALELVDQCPELDAVVVPVGGGGLISGVSTAIKAVWPNTSVVGVEPESANDASLSLAAGQRIVLDRTPDTIVDGVQAQAVGELCWEVISKLVDGIVTVTDTQALAAMELLWTRAKTVVEPAGALPLAAVLAGKVKGTRIGLILSGGNVDLKSWSHAISHETVAVKSVGT